MMMMMMMMTVIPVITVVGTGEIRDGKNCYENFKDCNKIILKRVEEDKIAGVTHTNTITTTYKDGGTPTVSRTSSRVSN